MMNRITHLRVAAVALAASALFVLPAAADAPAARATIATKVGGNTSLVVQVGGRDTRSDFRGDRGHRDDRRGGRFNQWGQTQWEVERLTDAAVQACRAGISREARQIGYRDVDFDSRARTEQIGPEGFRVFFREVEFEGRRRDRESSVSCTIRHGRIADIDGMPRPGRGYAYSSRDTHYRR